MLCKAPDVELEVDMPTVNSLTELQVSTNALLFAILLITELHSLMLNVENGTCLQRLLIEL